MVGEPLPAVPRMGCRCVCAYGQHRIEEKHALPCPWDETAVCGWLDPEIILHLLVNIEKGWRWIDADLDGKRKSVCLPVAVVRILSENDDLRIRKARVVQRVEDRKHIGIDALRTVFPDEKLPQFPIVGLCHLICEKLLPVVLENFLCHAKFSRKFQTYSVLRAATLSKQSHRAAAERHPRHNPL